MSRLQRILSLAAASAAATVAHATVPATPLAAAVSLAVTGLVPANLQAEAPNRRSSRQPFRSSLHADVNNAIFDISGGKGFVVDGQTIAGDRIIPVEQDVPATPPVTDHYTAAEAAGTLADVAPALPGILLNHHYRFPGTKRTGVWRAVEQNADLSVRFHQINAKDHSRLNARKTFTAEVGGTEFAVAVEASDVPAYVESAEPVAA